MMLPNPVSNCANHALDELRTRCGKNILPDMAGVDLLSMRAILMQHEPATQVSANSSCHLLQTRDAQWIALNLSRESDWELLPALFRKPAIMSTWEQVAAQVQLTDAADLLQQARSLGIAIALAQQTAPSSPANWFDVIYTTGNNQTNNGQPRVLDLSSLWAGPLCAQLLQQSGAQVIKVESKQRPDGARLNPRKGAQDFFSWLNKNKELVEVDFSDTDDIQHVKQLITQADIVIEGSRPRALRQLGIDAETIVKQQPGLVWVSITGYGRREPQANWIAYGDDAAISAGLFVVSDNKPAFIGDAIADPLTGLHAALAAHTFWQNGTTALLDVNLHNVSRHAARFQQ